MNTDNLIEQIHSANAMRRAREHSSSHRIAWRIAVPVAAAAAMLLFILLPKGNDVQAASNDLGIYCNSQCNPDDVMALIDNNINHIKEIKTL
ncbi:MAG: hypothetical protein IKR33_04225 [Bacteroidales bacterium]|nr:hypothetical protein [Bacteroidales bacterium]